MVRMVVIVTPFRDLNVTKVVVNGNHLIKTHPLIVSPKTLASTRNSLTVLKLVVPSTPPCEVPFFESCRRTYGYDKNLLSFQIHMT